MTSKYKSEGNLFLTYKKAPDTDDLYDPILIGVTYRDFPLRVKSQCRNISRISNQFRKIEFWFIPPKQPFGMVISENDIKKSPSALHLDNFRKVRKFTKKYNFYS